MTVLTANPMDEVSQSCLSLALPKRGKGDGVVVKGSRDLATAFRDSAPLKVASPTIDVITNETTCDHTIHT
jgi:hypothetical protein